MRQVIATLCIVLTLIMLVSVIVFKLYEQRTVMKAECEGRGGILIRDSDGLKLCVKLQQVIFVR